MGRGETWVCLFLANPRPQKNECWCPFKTVLTRCTPPKKKPICGFKELPASDRARSRRKWRRRNLTSTWQLGCSDGADQHNPPVWRLCAPGFHGTRVPPNFHQEGKPCGKTQTWNSPQSSAQKPSLSQQCPSEPRVGSAPT